MKFKKKIMKEEGNTGSHRKTDDDSRNCLSLVHAKYERCCDPVLLNT